MCITLLTYAYAATCVLSTTGCVKPGMVQITGNLSYLVHVAGPIQSPGFTYQCEHFPKELFKVWEPYRCTMALDLYVSSLDLYVSRWKVSPLGGLLLLL